MYDLNAHLQRIQYQGDINPSLTVLNDLHRHSALNIPFENFDVHLQNNVSLDKDAIFNKIVNNNRGGYCYELNGLFYDLLDQLGFKADYLIARPMLGYTHRRPKTHMLILVKIDNEPYICDLGFTGMSLLEPLKLQLDIPVTQYHQDFKIIADDEGSYQLQTLCHGNWVSLYAFDLNPLNYLDFEPANYFNSHSCQSICVTSPIAAIYTETGRIRLINDSIKVRTDVKEIIDVHSEQQTAEVLQQYFNLHFNSLDIKVLYRQMKK